MKEQAAASEDVEAQSGTANVAIGSVIMWAGSATAPTGWLVCNGKKYKQSQYQTLYKTIGDTFTPVGTPKTDFCVPDLRGLFVRGVNDDAANDPDVDDRTSPTDPNKKSTGVGSLQGDEFARHSHSYTHFPGTRGDIASGRYWAQSADDTGEAGGNETRPKNMYLYYLIKAL